MVLRLLGTVVLLSSLTAFASEADCPQEDAPTVADQLAQHVKGCPNNENVAALCDYIDTMNLEHTASTGNKYRYQTVILEASCVSPADSPTVRNQKIAKFWDTYGKHQTCSTINFNQQQGSLLKYAVSNQFNSFVIDVAHNWKLDLNKVDASDGRTPLDYAYDQFQLEESKGSSLAAKIKSLIMILEKSGAKRSKDL